MFVSSELQEFSLTLLDWQAFICIIFTTISCSAVADTLINICDELAVIELQDDLEKVKKVAEENRKDIKHLTGEMEDVKSALQSNQPGEHVVLILYLTKISFPYLTLHLKNISFQQIVKQFYEKLNTVNIRLEFVILTVL